MRFKRLQVLFPLVLMFVGMAFLFVGEREFDRRMFRDNAMLRDDLKQTGMPRDQIAALVSAQAQADMNASSYTQLGTFIVLIISIFMAIPLYAHLAVPSEKPKAES